jgi:hypothetical protein
MCSMSRDEKAQHLFPAHSLCAGSSDPTFPFGAIPATIARAGSNLGSSSFLPAHEALANGQPRTLMCIATRDILTRRLDWALRVEAHMSP